MVISALFASMGTGLPGALAAKLSFPNRQAIQVAGDGTFSMIMQDLITERKYHLPIINVITSNKVLEFIKSEQDDLPMHRSGIDLEDQNFAKIAEGMGVEAVQVTEAADLPRAFDQALQVTKEGRPFLIDVKVTPARSLPVEALQLHQENGKFVETVSPKYNANFDVEQPKSVRDFLDSYDGQSLKTLPEFFDEYGVTL